MIRKLATNATALMIFAEPFPFFKSTAYTLADIKYDAATITAITL
jgi:hypothetical protein